MVKDTCKQERKTQLQQAAFSRQAKRHTQKGKRTAAAAPRARRCRDKAVGRAEVRLACRTATPPSGRPPGSPSCEHLACLCPARSLQQWSEATEDPPRGSAPPYTEPPRSRHCGHSSQCQPPRPPRAHGLSVLMVTSTGRQESPSLGASSPEGTRCRHNQSLPGRLTRECSAHVCDSHICVS